MFTKLLQKRRIDKEARLINKVNQLYKEGRISKAQKLKKKLKEDEYLRYWAMQRSYELRDRVY